MTHHLPMYVAPDICGPCGGACCSRLPGSTSPEDWGAPDTVVMTRRITQALFTGRWSLDWWDAERDNSVEALRSTVYFVKPAIKGEEGEDTYPASMGSWFSRFVPETFHCTFFDERTGCELEHDARPLECRSLEPVEDGACIPHAGNRKERAIEWTTYQGVIQDARAALRELQRAAEEQNLDHQ